MKANKDVDCKYKKPCTSRDWEEHGYKCKNCIWNELSNKEEKLDWPTLFLMTGWF